MPSKSTVRTPLSPIALCYVRQSFTRDTSDTNSPERQRANIQTVCDREGWTPEWFVDAEGHRSGRYEANRPEWLRLKQHLTDPGVVAVVANDLARLHRKAWRVGRLVDEVLEPNGIRLVLAAPGRQLDTSTPMGRMLLMMIAMQDESYANDISQRAKDHIAYRKSQGKSIGMPPFGTRRGEDGYLAPALDGAWLLPNGHLVAGESKHDPPTPDAHWRGYYECAKRILELYANDNMGRERIAYQLNDEGYAFRDRKHRPRPVNKDDIRRVTSNWREYSGINTNGRAKDKNASMMENPSASFYDTGRAVFEVKLLARVAKVQEKRSETKRPRGTATFVYPYALARLLYCAQCERKAHDQSNPSLRSRLGGVAQYEKHRYRHYEGVNCGCENHSVACEVIEQEFRLLIQQLTLSPDAFDMLVELAVQSEHAEAQLTQKADLETQKHEAIAKCQRRIEAAKAVFLDGDMPREEYLKIKEQNEREIAHWQARTTETEKAAIELRMCMNMVNQILELWDTSPDEDRQQMAHMLFEYIVYDLDRRRIVDFRLKAWADRYLILRTDLYEPETETGSGEEKENAHLKEMSVWCPMGNSNPRFSLERAAS